MRWGTACSCASPNISQVCLCIMQTEPASQRDKDGWLLWRSSFHRKGIPMKRNPMLLYIICICLSLALSGWLVFLSDQGEAFLTSSVSHHHHLHCRSPRWHTLMDRSRCKSLHVTCTLPPHTLKHSRMWSTLQTNSGSTLSTIHVSLQVQYSYQCNLLFIVQGHFIQGWQLSFLNLEPSTTVTVKGVCLVVCTQMWEFPKWHEILQTHLHT